jgi:tetratricopeptide (TPR) repeat protein
VRSSHAKFKQWRHFAAAAMLPMVLFGCTSMPTKTAQRPADGKQPLHTLSVATPDADHDVAALLMQAEFALGKGDLRAAQKGYAKASQLSSDPKVAERAVGLALALHDSAAAQQVLARWKVLGADEAGLQRARAQIALDQGRTEDAQKALMALTERGSKQDWQRFGKVLLGARDAAQAGQLLEKIATPQRLPKDELAWLAMSELGQKLGRYAYAQQIADIAAERFRSSQTYAWAAQLHAQRGEDQKALALYAKAVSASPQDLDARMAYAGLLAKNGDNQGAERVLAKGPQNSRSFAARAAFAARTQDLPALKRIYGELRKAPDDVRESSYYLLGQLASLLDKPQEAVDWLAKVPSGDEHAFDAGVRRAVLLQQLGKPAQAHALVKRMRDDHADKADVVQRLDQVDAELYMRGGDYAKAAVAYTRALSADKHDAELLYGRGLAYAEAGDIDAAVADLRAVLRLKPDDINAVNALGYTLVDANRDLDQAEKLLARAHAAQPDDPSITDSWGWLQYRLGHLGKAEAALQASWKMRPDPEVGAHLVQVLLDLGKRTQAGKVYRDALKLDPDNRHLLALKGKL